MAFLKSDAERPLPDVQLLFTAAPLAAWPYFEPFKAPFPDGFATRIVATQPESRGSVKLASGDPMAAPLIHQNFLASQKGLANRCAPVSRWRAISAAQPSMQPFIQAEFFPGPDCRTDEEIDEHIRKTCITVHHPAGTCRGRDGYRDRSSIPISGSAASMVCAWLMPSVMPDLPCGNINAAVIMIAEKSGRSHQSSQQISEVAA